MKGLIAAAVRLHRVHDAKAIVEAEHGDGKPSARQGSQKCWHPITLEDCRAQAEGEAIGSACRHAGRALEDCYTLNPKASKADIFSGWRNMNDYMIENKIDIVPPTLADTTSHAPATEPAASDPADDAPPSRPRPPGRP